MNKLLPAPRATAYGRHAMTGGEYVTIDGISYSIAPQGPGKPQFHDKACHPYGAHTRNPDAPEWRR